MALSYLVLSAVVYAIYRIGLQYFPDFPISFDQVMIVIVWLLAQAGVVVADAPLRKLANGVRGLWK